MSKHFRCVDCCQRCGQKGIFSLEKDEADAWKCPFGDPSCNSRVVVVPWILLHKSNLIKGGFAALALWFLFYFLSGGDGKGPLRNEISQLQPKVNNWSRDVGKLRQNSGLPNPYESLWQDKYANRGKRLSEIPAEEIRREIEKLKEERTRLAAELGKAKELKAPNVKGPQVLAKYGKLKEAGRGYVDQLGEIRSKASIIDSNDFDKKFLSIEKQLKDGLASISKKAKQPNGKVATVDADKVKADYIQSVIGAQSRITSAIEQELARREDEKRLEEERRRKELAEQERKSREERIRAWNAASPIVKIACSRALESSLVSKLVGDYLQSKYGKAFRVLTDPETPAGGRYRRYISNSNSSIEVGAIIRGGQSGNDAVQINMNRGSLGANNSRVIALDGMVAMVNPAQSVSKITVNELERVLNGEITNWRELGSVDQPIRLFVPEEASGDAGVIDATAWGLLASNSSKTVTESVTNEVLNGRQAFGIGSFHTSEKVNRLAISSSREDTGFAPTPSAISAENYRYSRRVFAHVGNYPSVEVRDFLRFVEGKMGQRVVSRAGFIDLRIETVSRPLDMSAMPTIANAFGTDQILSAYRLNTNFRFALDSSELDIKAQADIKRVQDSLSLHLINNKKCLVVGFTDSQGGEGYNMELSKKRGSGVGSQLRSDTRIQGEIKTTGVGESMPISDNDTERGKSQNRRVEVWIVEIRQ